MANNPLYPGYSPKKQDEESINPIYPGYYTGQPLQRKPASKNFIKPVEYKADELMYGIDNAARKVLLAPFAGPRWVLERIVDDWKENLKVSIKPKDVEITELDDYATEDFPGAVISLSLNPWEWKKDPKKQALKTAKSWVKESTGLNIENVITGNDWSDIENKTVRELWKLALGYGRDEDEEGNGPSEIAIKASQATASRTASNFGGEAFERDDPLNLRGTPVEGDKGGIYNEAAKAIAGFTEQWDNAKDREKLRSKYIHESAKGIYTELKSKNIVGHQDTIEKFGAQVGLMDDISGLNKVIGDTTKDLKKSTLQQKDKHPSAPSTAWDQLDEAIKKAKKNHNDRKPTLQDFKDKNLDKVTSQFEEYLSNLENEIESLKASGADASEIVERLGKLGIGGTLDKKLTGEGTFKPSLSSDMASVLREYITNTAAGGIATVLTDSSIGEVRASKLIPIINRLERERIAFTTKEIINNWDQEKLLERYVWNRIKTRLPEITGGKFINDKLEKLNYFGLKITDAGTEKYNYLGENAFKRFAKRYGYEVGMKVDKSIFGVSRIKVTGGDHFKFLDNETFKAFKFTEQEDKDLLLAVLSDTFDKDVLTKKLFGKPFKDLSDDEKKKYDNFIKGLEGFKEWLSNNSGKFGSNLPGSQFALALLERFSKFNKDVVPGYELSKKYIGKLEIVHKAALGIKKWWESTWIGKSIKNFKDRNVIMSEKFAKWATGLIEKLIGGTLAAISPALSFLIPVIEKLIAFLVKKGLDYGDAIFKGIFKGEFKDFAKLISKDFNKIIKSCIVCSSCCASIFLLPIAIFLLIVAASISPIDETVGSSLYNNYIAPNKNENDVLIIEKDVEVTSGGVTQKNPSRIENSTLNAGITIKYTIKFKLKKPIGNAVITSDDIAIARNSTKSIEIGKYVESSVSFSNDEGYLYLSRSISGDSYKDSRVVNTAYAYIPIIDGVTTEEEWLGVSRTFVIGNPKYDVAQECEAEENPFESIFIDKGDNQNSTIALEAKRLVSGLGRGFWCYYNRNSYYPNLFDEALFQSNPHPAVSDVNNRTDSLFWCTWLIIKAYQQVDSNFSNSLTSVSNMKTHFNSGIIQNGYKYSYIPRESMPASNIKAGDVVFFKSQNPVEGSNGGHVGIVYSIISSESTDGKKIVDSIIVLQSNSSTVDIQIHTIDGIDRISSSIEGLNVEGFGSIQKQ